MNFPATDSAARCREQKGGYVLLQLDHGDCRAIPKCFGRSVALSLRQPFNANGRRTFRKEAIFITFRFDYCYFTSHELGKVMVGS